MRAWNTNLNNPDSVNIWMTRLWRKGNPSLYPSFRVSPHLFNLLVYSFCVMLDQEDGLDLMASKGYWCSSDELFPQSSEFWGIILFKRLVLMKRITSWARTTYFKIDSWLLADRIISSLFHVSLHFIKLTERVPHSYRPFHLVAKHLSFFGPLPRKAVLYCHSSQKSLGTRESLA